MSRTAEFYRRSLKPDRPCFSTLGRVTGLLIRRLLPSSSRRNGCVVHIHNPLSSHSSLPIIELPSTAESNPPGPLPLSSSSSADINRDKPFLLFFFFLFFSFFFSHSLLPPFSRDCPAMHIHIPSTRSRLGSGRGPRHVTSASQSHLVDSTLTAAVGRHRLRHPAHLPPKKKHQPAPAKKRHGSVCCSGRHLRVLK
ncbi:uncharacterized protein LY79DRAFT_205691 [Colletotrichum navitas]|uniref:Uncharacterized protein n=1 Tax=Colletotrichum navitas TaxID=681940 RepID=A0AAD8VC12_9PEZI|nr:uncharacterized protein LY79DRAFT_205691 [Colletotrichum navitas]KAK1599030.1 hypothetical protein LY79DRAFT_205691 [Colletotrichum navitas]